MGISSKPKNLLGIKHDNWTVTGSLLTGSLWAAFGLASTTSDWLFLQSLPNETDGYLKRRGFLWFSCCVIYDHETLV